MQHAEKFSYSAGEEHEKSGSKVEKLLSKIKGVKDKIAKKLGLSGEKLDRATDEALVSVATETITEADEDGVRTEEEKEEVQEAVSEVVVQGAMEQAGLVENPPEPDQNPIVLFDNEKTDQDLVEVITSLHEEDATLPNGQSVAELAVEAIENGESKWDRLEPTNRWMIRGKEYVDPVTGEEYDVVFMDEDTPDVEKFAYISGAIYGKIGICTRPVTMATIKGRKAIIYRYESTSPSNTREIGRDPDLRGGYVADAFLGNTDIFGPGMTSLRKTEDGHLMRQWNDFSILMREDKQFSPDDIPELITLQSESSAHSYAYGVMRRGDIVIQARELLSRLSEDDIREIVDKSGLEGETREKVLNGLLGRRKVLERICQEYDDAVAKARAELDEEKAESGERLPRRSMREVLSGLEKDADEYRRRVAESENYNSREEVLIRPKAEFVCDRDHIEDQSISIVHKTDHDCYEVTLKVKLASISHFEHTLKGRSGVKEDFLSFDKVDYEGPDDEKRVCRAYTFERDSVKVYIVPSNTDTRSMRGLIRIEAPLDMPPEEIQSILNKILEEELGIENALEEVSEDAEKAHKKECLRWHHKIEGDIDELDELEAEKLERVEVAPGYSTYIEPGKHKEYEKKYGEFHPYHTMTAGGVRELLSILTGGLLSSSERYKRGFIFSGMSTAEDLETGGGDSVFTRIGNLSKLAKKPLTGGFRIIFKPSLLDRTDWYSYSSDEYGTKDENKFQYRLSPDELLKKHQEKTLGIGNEQMFQTGIGPQYIEYVIVPPDVREEVLEALREKDIHEIGGKPIEEVILTEGMAISTIE